MSEPNEQTSNDQPVGPQVHKNADEAKAAINKLLADRWTAKKKGLSPHEAAHAIVADDLGYPIKDVNIGRDKDQKTTIDWKGLDKQLPKVNWHSAADVAAIKPKVLDVVTIYVAGHLAENEGRHSREPKISDRLTNKLLADGKSGPSDLDKVCHFLKLIGLATKDEVLAAEDRARKILARRAEQHKAVSARLFEVEFLEGDELQALLGKAHPPADAGH